MKGEDFAFIARDGVHLKGHYFFSGKEITVIALHGIGEHYGRHSYLQKLLAKNYNLVQFDLRGHGRSGGKRGYIKDFSFFIKDLEDLIQHLKTEKNIGRYFLFAHSMGSLIAWTFLRQEKLDSVPEKVFLCAPPVSLLGKIGKYIPQKLIQGLLKFPLKLWIPRPFSIKTLSHDPNTFKSVKADPFCLDLFSKQLVLGLAHTSKESFSTPFSPPCPVGVAIGSADKIVYAPAVTEYFSSCGNKISLKVIDGAFHEIHNELEIYRRPYFEFLLNFFKAE